jgi:bla regulator protein BlaR1
MMLTNLSPLANHLWQSTLCAAVAWLLALALRKNRAAVRYRIWLVASVKFLIPFSILVSAGSHFAWRAAPAIRQPQLSLVMDEVSRPFGLSPSAPLPAGAARGTSEFPEILLFAVWLCGCTGKYDFKAAMDPRYRAANARAGRARG